MKAMIPLALVLGLVSSGRAAVISGDYVETRSANVYTGPCVANAEAGLTGDQAIMAWRIREGSWTGVKLDGLGVVGVAKAKATLGDPYLNPYPAKSVLILDSRANARQRSALEAFAQAMAPELLRNVVKVETAAIHLVVGEGESHGSAELQAGNLAKVKARRIGAKDHLCGNEHVYYPPLTKLSHAMPAYTLADEFSGSGLGVTWRINGKTNAFVGHFSYDSTAKN
jgi:hypothetical protein